MSYTVRLAVVPAIALVLAACAANETRTDDDAFTSAPSSESPAQAIWSEVDYLPWDYAPDGCFARSFYVSMELAARGVPVSQEIVNVRWAASPDNPLVFAPVDGRDAAHPPITFHGREIGWEYHIAALLLPPVVDKPTIIDKAMESGPVPLDTWVAHVNTGGIPKSAPDAQGNMTIGYNEFTTPGSNYVGVGPSLAKTWDSVTSPSMTGYPHFKIDEVKLVCQTVMKVYDCLGNAADPRRNTLVKRTNELAKELAQRNLLDLWDGASFTCPSAADDSFHCASERQNGLDEQNENERNGE